jgi:cytochrome c peroxidase
MSLRNIAITPPYGHNGVFATLEQITHFYNTRDVLGQVANNLSPDFGVSGWPKPEVLKNVNHDELGNLGLTPAQEQAVVAFMKTLTDDYPEWGNDPLVPPGTPSPFAGKP